MHDARPQVRFVVHRILVRNEDRSYDFPVTGPPELAAQIALELVALGYEPGDHPTGPLKKDDYTVRFSTGGPIATEAAVKTLQEAMSYIEKAVVEITQD